MTDMHRTTTIVKVLLLSIAALLFSAALPALAAEKTAPAELTKNEAVSYYFNRSGGEIEALRAEGFGYGEIVKIFVIAEMARRPLGELLEENRKGYGWGTISVKLGLNPVFVKRRVDSARRELDISVRPAVPKQAVKK